MKIVLVAPYDKLAKEAEQVCRTYGERVEIVVGNMEHGVQIAKKAVEDGAGVLISRGGTLLHLSGQTSSPTVEIAVTPYDVLRALEKARSLGTRFGISGFINVIGSMKEWSPMLNVPVVPVPIEIEDDGERVRQKLRQVLKRNKVDCILGDVSVVEQAAELGIPSVLIESGKEAIWAALQEGKRIISARLAERQTHASLRSALDRANQGVLLLEQGMIQFANRLILELIGRDGCVGLAAADCLPHALYDFIVHNETTKYSEIIQLGGNMWFIEVNELVGEDKRFITLQPVDDIESIERRVRQKRASGGHVAHYTFDDLYGQSQKMRFIIARAIQFAQTESSVLIVGETGTGKEVLAQSIHNASMRSNGPFVAVNCAALPDQLLESELFGYEDGAFTGARRGGKPGLFEQAHGGTIFLDEIGETPLHVQQRLLRVLQERQVMRIGGERVIPVDVRVLAATNQPLWQFVLEGKFRKDLFFRLDVLRLNTVPLRERLEDIPELVERLLHQMWYQHKGVGARPHIDGSVYPLLQRYHWPGNIRELQNMVDYLIATANRGQIDEAVIREWFTQKSLPEQSDPSSEHKAHHIPFNGTLEDIERWAIEYALKCEQGDMTRTATRLGVSRTTLWRKLKEWQSDTSPDGTNLA